MIALALLAVAQQRTSSESFGHGYWQQEVAYEISARLDEPKGLLDGHERIRYTNRSPDTLQTFSLHLYLNAFRPGSRWADADSVEGRRRFNDLRDPDYAFNHVRRVRIMDQVVDAIYPFAPDSTVVRFVLPRPLAPSASMTVEMDWDARPSTVPRRQGRAGRRFDFAQWYPKVVVYDRYGWEEHPLYPAGEFYGEFATFLVDLDVPDDQVIGATGVPVCGDPGWARASRAAGHGSADSIDYQRTYYAARTPPSDVCTGAEPRRKRVRWYAEDVHHFALSLNPDYRYEGGRFGDVAVHVLYQPGDSSTWGGGIAVRRTQVALNWLDQVYGRFGWPQITNVHRIEGGGTEFPMMIMNGSADQGLIVHELGHNYTMGMLANNEWREGWLDEGFTSFQSQWFDEVMGRPGAYERTEASLLNLDLDRASEPTSLVSERYRDFTSYNVAIYSRGSFFFQQLRYVVGDETMLQILRTFYDRWKFKHVDEAAFRSVAEEVSHRDLSTLFAQGLHGTPLYDYGVGTVKARRDTAGWTTRVEVVRHTEGRIPVEVAVLAERDTAVGRVDGLGEREWVDVRTASKPREVWLDPRLHTHDWNMLDNRRRIGFSLAPKPGVDVYVHPYFSTRSRRDGLTVGLHPVAWYNAAGGVTLGVRSIESYLARFEQNVGVVTRSTGWGVDADAEETDVFWRIRNPVFLRVPNLSQTFEAFRVEGRYGVAVAIERTYRDHLGYGPVRSTSATLRWVAPDDFRYLDPGFYDDAGIVELSVGHDIAIAAGAWQVKAGGTAGGGLAYHRQGLAATGRTDLDPFYFRGTFETTARRPLGRRWTFAARLFAGYAGGDREAAKQRQIYAQGADPFERLYNPFLRSRGALLVREGMHYDAPGGAGIRGIDPRVSTTGLASLSAELERTMLAQPARHLFRRVGIAAFSDVGHGIGAASDPRLAAPIGWLADAGVGLRIDHRIGATEFTTRGDLPLYVSAPALAQDRGPGAGRFGFRWTFSFAPAF